ncbi:SnoaL-like domain-containing protein [Sphingopyxis sp. YR583]|uniref:nuclear transport factor 2 family protein n=1 Tax=Sphingopyxis sp. YR583 TaxID=1881047 RepID=UPI0008A79C32|nr:nuclear transport factor 2 family protein [Sphingopyxis sp. YR583]SEH19161.1 SnoaL-like domain-containing protein [Sphingopyxis sp. YR583]
MGKTADRVGGATIDTPGWADLEEVNARQKQALRNYIDAVNRKDVEAIVSLFAENGVVEDPYGNRRHNICGSDEIRQFYEFVVAKARMELLLVTGSGGNAAAMAIRGYIGADIVNNISIAHFDEAGKIAKYTTYWGPGDRSTG